MNKRIITAIILSSASSGFAGNINLTIKNSFNLNSSAQNVWVCGVGIKNSASRLGEITKDTSDVTGVGSDNRVYFSYEKKAKGGITLSSGTDTGNDVVEARTDDSKYTFPFSGSNHASENYFNTQFEYHFSDIRVELASLNYGANILIDFCMEAPFAYDDTIEADYQWNLEATHQILSGLNSQDYIKYAQPSITTKTVCTNSPANNMHREDDELFLNGHGKANVPGGIHINSVGWDSEFISVDTSPVPGDILYSTTLDFDGAFDRQSGEQARKCVIRMKFKETPGTRSRLKGLTESLQWRQIIESQINTQN